MCQKQEGFSHDKLSEVSHLFTHIIVIYVWYGFYSKYCRVIMMTGFFNFCGSINKQEYKLLIMINFFLGFYKYQIVRRNQKSKICETILLILILSILFYLIKYVTLNQIRSNKLPYLKEQQKQWSNLVL